MLGNLWKETKAILDAHQKDWSDVLQVQASGVFFSKDDARAAMKATVFHKSAPGDEVAIDLVIVGAGWAMKWASGWVWMEVPAVIDGAAADCPDTFSTSDFEDSDGCRFPEYGKTADEIKQKKSKK
jgi:hypothetical protein